MKYLVLILLFFLSADCFSQKKGVFKADVVVDGDLSEWGEKLDHYDKDNMLWYSVANDEEFLYLAIFKDVHALKVASEVQVFVSEKTISKETPSISYPADRNKQGGVRPDTWEFLSLNNWDNGQSYILSIYNEWGIQAKGLFKETEEAKEKKRQRNSLFVNGVRAWEPGLEPSPSEGMTAYIEFGIPLKYVKGESRDLNVKIRLKGGSETTDPYYLAIVQRNQPEGPSKVEVLDVLVESQHSFTYTLVKKEQ